MTWIMREIAGVAQVGSTRSAAPLKQDGRRVQGGQAMAEAVISLLVLAVLWAAVVWLGNLQDLALHASSASRYSAFVASRHDELLPSSEIDLRFFDQVRNQWVDRSGTPLLESSYQGAHMNWQRAHALPSSDQIGGSMSHAVQLRDEWGLSDPGITTARIVLRPTTSPDASSSRTGLLGLRQLDSFYPDISRHTSIATGAGHASDDASTAQRTAASEYGWGAAAGPSYRLGTEIQRAAAGVDSGWNRPSPVFDWLGPWSDRLPAWHERTEP